MSDIVLESGEIEMIKMWYLSLRISSLVGSN